MRNVLELFDTGTRKWFQSALGEPTLVQQEAWPGIASGRHVPRPATNHTYVMREFEHFDYFMNVVLPWLRS